MEIFNVLFFEKKVQYIGREGFFFFFSFFLEKKKEEKRSISKKSKIRETKKMVNFTK
uniref:Uncharacterized protein n=1 Tax=viral metagenome TaxID=1070528 RepID=A0A6C0KY14_9ZZZZ